MNRPIVYLVVLDVEQIVNLFWGGWRISGIYLMDVGNMTVDYTCNLKTSKNYAWTKLSTAIPTHTFLILTQLIKSRKENFASTTPTKTEVCHETEATPSYSQSLTSLIRCQESWLSLVYFASKQEFISRADTMQCKAGFYVGYEGGLRFSYWYER